MKNYSRILKAIYLIFVTFFLLDNLVNFDIKSQIVKSFVYWSILFLTPIVLLWNLIQIKKEQHQIFGIVGPVLIIGLLIYIGILKVVFSTGSWKTQTILFENNHFNFKKIEYQMQDLGALGYNNRTVEVIYLSPLLMIANDTPTNLNSNIEWRKVNNEINELGLKFP